MKVFTIGYERCEVEEFVAFLRARKIRVLADLRKNPVSRKRGFSKSRLAESLRAAGLEYRHFPDLGMPTAWRKAAKAELISRKKMFSEYAKKVLPREEAQRDLRFLLELTAKGGLAVLCYEADASDCHRSFVAKKLRAMARKSLEIVDLKPADEPARLTGWSRARRRD